MKKIANKVAVQTICYTIPDYAYIRIVDYPTLDALFSDDTPDGSAGTVVFDNEYGSKRYKDWKYFHSECHRISAYHAPETGLDLLIFRICSAGEKY